MALDFPTSPTVNQTYTSGGSTWKYDGASWISQGAPPTSASAANTVATFANGTIVLANANLNFNNTATVNVSAQANGTTQTNISFSVNTSAVTGGSGGLAGAAYDQANLAYDQANAAYGEANNRVAKTGDTMTGILKIDTASLGLNVVNDVVVGNSIQVGYDPIVALPHFLAQFNDTFDGYVQVSMQNKDANANASADYVITADDGSDTAYYLDLGLNGSGHDSPDFNIVGAHGGYLYNLGGDLAVGTAADGTNLIFFTSGTLTGNEAMRIWSNSTVNVSNTLIVKGKNVEAVMLGAYDQANTGRGTANLAYDRANAAYGQANFVYGQANTYYDKANSAYDQANSAYARANTANGTVTVHANGTLTLANANINFNNTASVNVAAQANGTGQVNISFVANTTAIVVAAKNTTSIHANGTIVLSNANVNFNNTATVNVSSSANGTGQANIAFVANTTAIVVAAQNTTAVHANGTIVLANANVNFNNTATVNVAASANGTGQSNISFVANTTAIVIAAQNSTSILANGTLTLANANINFNNTSTVNVATSANGTTQVNVAFSVNTSAIGGGGGSILISANSLSTLSDKNLNFINTSTVTVSVVPSGDGTNANVSFVSTGAVATPAGSDTEIQFNDGGATGASAQLTFTKTSNTLSVSNGQINLTKHDAIIPPTENTIALFAKSAGGRMMPAFVGPAGVDSPLQPFWARNHVGFWNWIGNSTTTALAIGLAAPTTTGTATTRTTSPTNFFTSVRRIGYVSAATAGGNASIRQGVATFLRGNTAGQGGFHYIARFGVADASPVTNAMMFIGLSNTIGVIANNSNTAALTLCIGVGQIPKSNQLHIITNNTAASAATINTGLQCNIGSTFLYDVALFAAPNSSNVAVSVYDIANTLNSYSTIITANTTNLPPANTMLGVQQWRTNNNQATAVALDFVSTYTETDT